LPKLHTAGYVVHAYIAKDLGESAETVAPPPQPVKTAGRAVAESRGEQSERARIFEEGKQAGFALARREQERERSVLRSVIETLQRERDQLLRESEVIIVRLAYEIAKKIIHQEAQTNPDVILYIVRESIRRAAEGDKLTVILHPEDLAVVRACVDTLVEDPELKGKMEFKSDAKITRGGCIVETNLGHIDAQIETQLEEVEQALMGSNRDD